MINGRMPYLYLIAVDDGLADAFASSFGTADDVSIVRQDFASFMSADPPVDGIVSPANSFGLLTGGFDKALRDFFGTELQEAVRYRIRTEWYGEQIVGTCMAVDIPNHPGRKLLHTPTMRIPSVILDYQIVYLCMRSALMAAIREKLTTILVPAFGGGTGNVPKPVIAQNMKLAYDQIKDQLDNPHMDVFRTAAKVIRSGL